MESKSIKKHEEVFGCILYSYMGNLLQDKYLYVRCMLKRYNLEMCLSLYNVFFKGYFVITNLYYSFQKDF